MSPDVIAHTSRRDRLRPSRDHRHADAAFVEIALDPAERARASKEGRVGAALAGAKTPADLDGLSMARALTGQSQPTHEYFYWEFHERGFQQAVRSGPWKAVRLKVGAPLELYNLDTDPAEQNDVAPANPDVVERLETYLRTARTDSPLWPVK